MPLLFLIALSACSVKKEAVKTSRKSTPIRSMPKNPTVFAPAKGTAKCNKDMKQAAQQYAVTVQHYYSQRLAVNPGMRGRVVLALKISDRGSVSEARVTRNSTRDQGLEVVLRANAMSWSFPKSCPGWISLPYKLQPSKQLPGKKSTIPMPLFNH